MTSNDMFKLQIVGNELEELRATWTKIEFLQQIPHIHSHLGLYYCQNILLVVGGEIQNGEEELDDAEGEVSSSNRPGSL